jgi:hypothetical protein
MYVSLDWLAKINVIINTTVIQTPSFNNCLIIGLFPSGSIPASWGGKIYHGYSNLADILADFSALITGTTTQDTRYQYIINGATEFFSQQPTQTNLFIAQIDPATANYITAINTITAAFNNFYAFYIADALTATQMTQSNGVYAAMTSLTSANNLKILFVDTNDLGISSGDFLYDVTHNNVGNPRVLLCAHTLNLSPSAGATTQPVSLACAAMGAYFSNLFTNGIGLKSLSGQQLSSTIIDTAISTTSLGVPGDGSGILGVNGNVYPGYGSVSIGLMQYGFMAASNPSSLLYLDQIVGADYIKINVQADLVTYLISKQPTGGVPYSDVGIQNLLQVFRKTLEGAVNQNIIQQFSNSDVLAVSYANTPLADKGNRIYQGLSANLTYLSRIQRLAVTTNIGL